MSHNAKRHSVRIREFPVGGRLRLPSRSGSLVPHLRLNAQLPLLVVRKGGAERNAA